MAKPRVRTKCVANKYAAHDERIVEYSFPDIPGSNGCGAAGGLIAFHVGSDGKPRVTLYMHDDEVAITVRPAHARN